MLWYIKKGWPTLVPKALKSCLTENTELSVEGNFLLWGGRVVIPQTLKKLVSSELHKEHMGVPHMKSLACGHIWWLGIDTNFEILAKSCSAGAAVKQAPANAPLHPWEWPKQQWKILYIDFAGQFF